MISTFRTRRSIFAKLAFTAAALLWFALPFHTFAQDSVYTGLEYYDWYIESFDSVIEVREDASLHVTETITAVFNEEKHGIFREIPTVYKGEYGEKVKIDLELLSIGQDGGDATFDTYHDGVNKGIKIGDADTVIEGAHVYEIVYEVDRAVLFFEDRDEVYWNVTGNDWTVPILEATAVIEFPDGAILSDVSCYTGVLGSTYSVCESVHEDEIAAFAANDMLTISASVQKGVLEVPTSLEKMQWFFLDNWPIAIPAGVLLFVIVYWWKRGRDPRVHEAIVVEYDAPKDIEAVYAGLLTFQRMKKDFLVAMIIQMAVSGVLQIKVLDEIGKKGEGVTLIRKRQGEDLDGPHQLLLQMLFGTKKEVELSKIKGTIKKSQMEAFHRALFAELTDRGWYVKRSFFRRWAFLALAGVMGMLSIAVSDLFGTFIALSFFFVALIIAVFAWFMPQPTKVGARMRHRVAGFCRFMHTAERYREKWHEEERMFTRLLPYAIAFDDVKRWVKTFDGIEQVAPEWYLSNAAFTASIFGTTFDELSQSFTIATAPVAPGGSGGSGFSGGGSSGGGYGGGGGGSW